ncbi:hypothetical protein BV511_15655 [Methylorubrum extorquens]|nr:hypothetical protein BV511_15655 [Methylorubrum extorquens]
MHPGYAFEDCYEPDTHPPEPTFADGGIWRDAIARKAHACADCRCGRGIRPGEHYRVHVGLDEDGAFFVSRHCTVMPDGCARDHAREIEREQRLAVEPELPFPPVPVRPQPALADDDHLPF